MNYILAYLPYAFITAYTPGPNNILALNSISRKGLKKGWGTMLGIALGFLLVMILCAILSMELVQYVPKLSGVLKYLGAAYIIWLAVHILLSKPIEDKNSKKGDFLTSFFLQFMNVKIILYAITIYSGYILPYSASKLLLLTSVVFNTLVGMSGCLTWALAGQLLQKQFIKHYRIMNAVMAIVLLWSAIQLI
jgi:Putative threonine efflux protein